MVVVTPRYFETLGIPLIRGRAFDRTDGTKGHEAAIVNERFAAVHFPSGRHRFNSGRILAGAASDEGRPDRRASLIRSAGGLDPPSCSSTAIDAQLGAPREWSSACCLRQVDGDQPDCRRVHAEARPTVTARAGGPLAARNPVARHPVARHPERLGACDHGHHHPWRVFIFQGASTGLLASRCELA
jgi:hypothetical protein